MNSALVRFVHISDTHLIANEPPDTVSQLHIRASTASRRLVEAINGLPFAPDFVLHTGDIMHDPSAPEDYQAAAEILDDIKYPVHYLPGNHDNVEGVQRYLGKEQELKSTYDYELEVNGVHFVCIDSATHRIDDQGKLSEAQIAWLETVCAPEDDRPLVIAIHHPVRPIENDRIDRTMVENGDAIHAIFRQAGPRLRGVFSGHIHQAIDIVEDGVHYSFTQNYQKHLNFMPTVEAMNSEEAIIRSEQVHSPGFSLVMVTAERLYVRRYRFAVPLT